MSLSPTKHHHGVTTAITVWCFSTWPRVPSSMNMPIIFARM